ncbi:LysM peptidoglycan-binding domain-containing protein [Nakamurella sp. GG22]
MRVRLSGPAVVLALVLTLALQPAAATVASASGVPGGGQDDKQGGDYVVQPGDTLSQIALDNGIAGGHPRLYDLNDDVLTDADHIYAGQRIAVTASVPRRADGSPGPLVNPSIPDLPADQLAPKPLPDSFPDAAPGAPWVVSLGDSFISGEAGRWAGNTDGDSSATDALGPTAYDDDPAETGELIPLCHRSTSAMIHIADDGTPMTTGDPVNSLNLACSGAQTGTFTESGAFKPGIDFYNEGPGQQGQAFMLQEFAKLKDVRMVVVSIGGNDFGFGTVIQTCVEDFLVYFSYCSQDSKVTDRADPANIKAVSDKITTALGNVRQAMRVAGRSDDSWTLVFNLNPDPLVLGDGFRYGEHLSRQDTGGCGVYDTDANWAGTTFIGAVRHAQQEAVQAAGIPRSVLLDLGSWLDDRKLCSTTTSLVGSTGGASTWQSAGAVDVSEWANQIHLDTVDGPYFQQESLHPNYWAQLAARSCLRQVYDGGTPSGGTCVRSGDGLTSRGEPVMTLQ